MRETHTLCVYTCENGNGGIYVPLDRRQMHQEIRLVAHPDIPNRLTLMTLIRSTSRCRRSSYYSLEFFPDVDRSI